MREIIEKEPDPTNYVDLGNQKYDLNNISGMRKVQLIEEGEMTVDEFISPPNMPGKKLVEMRNRHRQQFEDYFKRKAKTEQNPYQVGDIVVFKKKAVEVLEVDPEKGVKIKKHSAKKNKVVEAWVHHTKVTPALSGE